MAIRRYWSPFEEIENEISNIFRRARTESGDVADSYSPLPLDFVEDSDGYEIVANLPGFDKDNISIEATSQYIELKAEKDIDEEYKDKNVLIRERGHRKMMRKINFSKPIDPNGAKTTIANGVLQITLPKSEAAKSVKLIPESSEE